MLISNTCMCSESPEDNCYGECWDLAFDEFAIQTEPLFKDNQVNFFIEGFPVWNGTRRGGFEASNARELIGQITPPRTEWSLTYSVEGEVLTGTLSHHDGSGVITVTKRL